MATTKQAEASILTEHLKYTPLTLLDEVINSINDLSARAIDGAESGLLAADGTLLGFADKAKTEGRALPAQKTAKGKPVFPEAKLEIEVGVHQLETLLEANIDKNFDKFEIITLRSILSVPPGLGPWIRLAHYEDVPEGEAQVRPEELQVLRQRVQETRKLGNQLRATVRRNDVLIEQLRNLTGATNSQLPGSAGQLSFLANGSSASSLGVAIPPAPLTEGEIGPLSTNTSFALSQLPALKELVAQLKPKLAHISKSAGIPATEADVARERRHFIETQSIKAIERQGLTSGTGYAEGLGRVVTLDEMMALESLVDSNGEEDDDAE
jgi:kinetochore protein Mis12/MTW1